MDLTANIKGVKLNTPLVLASGILGTTGASLANIANSGAGAVTTKSICIEERKGHPGPVIITFDGGMLNAVGLSNGGIKESIEEIEWFKKNSKVPVISSIFASTVKDFGKVAKEVSKAKPDMIEVNISCPNVEDEFGKPFACDANIAANVTKEVKKNTKIAVAVKLSPNVPDIKEIAKAVEKAGADCITAINTVGPGMAINIENCQPILHNKTGGVSGPAIKPIAIRCVYDIYEAVKIPIIGTGGVSNGRDAVEMIMAGATAVGVGTAVYYRGADVFRKINDELKEFMKKEGYKSVKEMVGKAHVK